ncbi:reverse transcriptase domain-containing protein [Mesorhizobium sp. M1169]|uniref:reverse transcriptase domain-containing protein n=1 Tax=Mesorhizobium sp. M1169 TaxID=2957066 RepID=UPI003338AD36
MIIVRYADDVIVGFEREHDARRFLSEMRARLEEVALSLHPDKTRLIEFGRHAAANRKQRGLGKPETFAFLEFTLICGKSRQRHFQLQRKTRGRMGARLKDIKVELRRRMHWSIPKQRKWLSRPLGGTSHTSRFQQISGAHSVQVSCDRPLPAYAPATQPEGRRYVGMDRAVSQRLPSQALQPSSMAECSLRRQTPEVGATCGKPPAWICAGGAQQ